MVSHNGLAALPIRRLTLYKHGVGFVERQGTVTGDEVRLVFRADEVNDALKSLLVIDRRGGQVLGIRYDTPHDAQAREQATTPDAAAHRPLLDLLRSLRGWAVRVVGGEGSQTEEIAGRLLGVDMARADVPWRDVLVSVADEDSGAVTSLPLGTVRRVVVVEERARGNLRYFLDNSRGEGPEGTVRRTVAVRLGAGEHDLAVSYLVPSPTWRVSYRLVAEPDAPGAPAGGAETAAGQRGARGTVLLQGWGLFDNRLEEDLDDVAVTLVAGQPISFVYDLATSRIPRRPTVEDTTRIAAGPVEFADALPAAPDGMPGADAPSFLRRRSPPSGSMAMAAAAPMAPPATLRSLALREVAQQQVAATGGDLGELFQYDVVAPVTVKRGESALVPILSVQLPYRRELLFNERKMPHHPVAALRFVNETGLVLERGPVTVVEDGAYRGEALVPFTRQSGEVYLAFAVELGLRVTSSVGHSQETVGLRISGALLEMRQASVARTEYRLENSLAAAQHVTVEHPIWFGAEVVGMPEPEARTAEHYRWTVACASRRATTFAVVERRCDWHASQLLDLSYERLQEFLSRHWLDGAAMARIRGLLDEQSAITRNREEARRLEVERAEVYAREEQLRANMAALGTAGDEGVLRRQVVSELAASEERIGAVRARIAELQGENARRQAALDAELAGLRVDGSTEGQ